MATQAEKAEHAVSALMRLGISLIVPVWGLVMIGLGVEYRSPWWLATGAAVAGVGLLLLVGSPLGESATDLHEKWRSAAPPKSGSGSASS